MPLVNLNYDQAHEYVERQQKRGNKVWWDGWDIKSFTPHPVGFWKKDGALVDGQWGVIATSKVSEKGTWRVNESTRRTRHRS